MKSILTVIGLTFFIFFCASGNNGALAQAPTVDFLPLTLSGPNLVRPVDMANASDSRMFIIEQRGTIRILNGTQVLNDFFLDIQTSVDDSHNEEGLLGLAFHPNYPTTPYYYVNYTHGGGSTVARFEVDPNFPDSTIAGSEMVVLQAGQTAENHNGGDLAFGPSDGYLYIGFGDGGSFNDPFDAGQDSTTFLGKMLRIDVDGGTPYAIPGTNPYANNPNVLSEIWQFGLRNPWRFSFDRNSGDLWIADVGQGQWEEINCVQAGSIGGENFGWDCFEGFNAFEQTDCAGASAYTPPLFAYPHGCGNGCPNGNGWSVTGGFVYRGSAYPSLQGYYICADYGSEGIWLIQDNKSSADISFQDGSSIINDISTFGEDMNGELFAASLGGTLYRVAPEGALPLSLIKFDARWIGENVQIDWQVESVENVVSFNIERSANGVSFQPVNTVLPARKQKLYQTIDKSPLPGRSYYRLKTVFADNSTEFSDLVSLHSQNVRLIIEARTAYNGGLILASTNALASSIEVLSADARLVAKYEMTLDGSQAIPESEFYAPGAYFIRIDIEGEDMITRKWIKN